VANRPSDNRLSAKTPGLAPLGALLGAAAALLAVLSFVAVPLAQAQSRGAWGPGARMEQGRSHLGAAVVGEFIYVAGGSGLLGPLDTFEAYDTRSDFWRPLPSLPEGVESFAMAAMKGRLYLTGGYAGEDSLPSDRTWIYNTSQSTWLEGPRLPSPRAGHAMVEVNGRLYIIGGRGEDAARVLALSAGGDRWQVSGEAMPEPRTGLAVVVLDGAVYALGGQTSSGKNTARVDRFDAQSGTWRRAGSMPSARAGHAAGVIDGRIHVAGGSSLEAMKTFTSHDVWDPSGGGWSSGPALPAPRHSMVSAVVGPRWYVIGGGSGVGVFTVFTPSDAVEVFDPTAR